VRILKITGTNSMMAMGVTDMTRLPNQVTAFPAAMVSGGADRDHMDRLGS
jgi:hypothetical protein